MKTKGLITNMTAKSEDKADLEDNVAKLVAKIESDAATSINEEVKKLQHHWITTAEKVDLEIGLSRLQKALGFDRDKFLIKLSSETFVIEECQNMQAEMQGSYRREG